MAQPNFQYEKRQKDLAKKKKQEEKRQRKLDKGKTASDDNPGESSETTEIESTEKTE